MTKHQKLEKKIMSYKIKEVGTHKQMTEKERKKLLDTFTKELNYLNGILADDCDKLEEKHPGRVVCFRKIWRDKSLCARIGICNSWYGQVKSGNQHRKGINYLKFNAYFEKKKIIKTGEL
jgi:hypothetical protein